MGGLAPTFGERSSSAYRREYLRNLGALDEADPKKPTGVIPNCMTRHTNGMESSGFGSIRCFDEGEGLLRHLERGLAVPIVIRYLPGGNVTNEIVEELQFVEGEIDRPRLGAHPHVG